MPEKASEKTKIQFKPLHEGMGFHPFSDGLPYAPESKNKSTANKYTPGTGATSAGRPQFATSNLGASKPIGTARQLQNQTQTAPIAQHIQTRTTIHKPVKISPNAEVVAAMTMPASETRITTSGSVLRRRFFAYLMDTFIHAGFWLATNLTALFFFKFQIDSEILKDNFIQFFVFFLISQWMFIALQEMLFGNSIGKVFFNLEFKRNHGSLLLRSMVFMIGLLLGGIGAINRWQDKIGQIQLKSKIYSS